MSSKDWADEKADQIVLKWNRPTARPINELIAEALRAAYQQGRNDEAAEIARRRAHPA